MWQADVTVWQLAVRRGRRDPQPDRRPLAPAPRLRRLSAVKAADVVDSFHKAAELHGLPASLLTDNGAVFIGTYRRWQGAPRVRARAARHRVQELAALSPPDLRQGRAPAPDAQALPRQAAASQHALRAPGPARRLRALLQPHRGRTGRFARPHAPTGLQRPRQGETRRPTAATYFRVRQDKVDKTGKVSLRYDSRLYKIGIGRAHKGRAVKLLIADQTSA